jgi:hypothetical protein
MRGLVLPALADLTDKSLITTHESASGRRFRFLESIRVYALAKLEQTDRRSPIEDLLLQWANAFSEEAIEDRLGLRSKEMGKRIIDEFENLSRASEIATQRQDHLSAVRISMAISAHWQIAGYPSRAADQLRRAMLIPDIDRESAIQIRTSLADLVKFTSDDDSLQLANEAYQLALGQPQTPVTSAAIRQLALTYLLNVDEDSSRSVVLAGEAVAAAVSCGDPYAELWSRRVLAKALAWNGEHDEADRELAQCGQLARTAEPSYEGFKYSHQVLYSDPNRRRDQPVIAMRDIEERFSHTLLDWEAIRNHGIEEAMTWRTWVHCQVGDLDAASEAAAKYSATYREGFSATGQIIANALVTWMRGDLEAAWAIASSVDEADVTSRWYHDYFPLLADIAADLGDLDSVRQVGQRWLDESVHSSEESMKLGFLNPLVRAEVDAALNNADRRSDHSATAREHVAQMSRIFEDHPPLNDGSLSMETPKTHLAFARAELSRLDGGDPDLWEEAVRRADYVYFRLYGRIRLAESHGALGNLSGAMSELDSALEDARQIGTKHLVSLGEEIGNHLDASI